MGLYFFNLYDGLEILDDEGTDLVNLKEARKHAMRYLGAVLTDTTEAFYEVGGWRLEVTDERKTLLFTIHAHAIEAFDTDFVHPIFSPSDALKLAP